MSRSNSVSPPGVGHPGMRRGVGTEHKPAWPESVSVSNGCPYASSRAPPPPPPPPPPAAAARSSSNHHNRWRDHHDAATEAHMHRTRPTTTTTTTTATVSRVSFRSRSAWQDHGERSSPKPLHELRASKTSLELQERARTSGSCRRVLSPSKLPTTTSNKPTEPEEDYAMPQVTVASCCASVLQVFKSKKFQSEKLERLYQRYFFRLNQSSLTMLMAVLVLLFSVMLGFHCAGGEANATLVSVFAIAIFLILVLMVVCNRNAFHQDHMWMVCYALILLVLVVQVIGVMLVRPLSAQEGVWWTVFFIHIVYTLLPVRMRAAVITGLALSGIHVVVSGMLNGTDGFVWKQDVRSLDTSVGNGFKIIGSLSLGTAANEPRPHSEPLMI
uniref:Adenylate cyclase N-terminal domain-containing protein n=1 Tax=Knipowitschia caucasica TaxID=637954 RepID=A0AAV2JZS4_KNICA